MTSHDRKKGSKINVADRVLLDQLLSWIIIEIFIKKIFYSILIKIHLIQKIIKNLTID